MTGVLVDSNVILDLFHRRPGGGVENGFNYKGYKTIPNLFPYGESDRSGFFGSGILNPACRGLLSGELSGVAEDEAGS